MKLLKMRLRVILSYILILVILCNSNFFSLIAKAAMPNNYIGNLAVQGFLNGGSDYKIIRLNNRTLNEFSHINFYFDDMKVEGILENAVNYDSDAVHDFYSVKIGDTIYNRCFIVSKGLNYIESEYRYEKEYCYIATDYTSYNAYNYTEDIVEFSILCERDVFDNIVNNTAMTIIGVDENGNDILGYDLGAEYDVSTLPSEVNEYIYAPFETIEEIHYGVVYTNVETPTGGENFLGWMVTDIDDYYQQPEYYLDYTCDVKLTAIYSDTHVKVNYYTKENTLNDSYTFLSSDYIKKEQLTLRNGISNLTDGVYIGWDKSVSDIINATGEIDLYAQYGKKTAITQQPVSVSVYDNETVQYNIEAVGENLQYKWIIGSQLKEISIPLDFSSNNEFIKENGYYVSTNKDAYSTSTMISNEFSVDDNAKLSFDYKSSSEENYDQTTFTICKIVGGVEQIYNQKQYSGVMSDFTNEQIALEKGTYKITVQYEKDSSTDDGDDCFYIKNINYTGYELEGNVFSTDEDPTIDSSNPNFTDGILVQCEVIGTYGIVHSDIVGLEVLERQKELLSISASYNGETIKVGNNYNKLDVIVTAKYKITSTGEEYDQIVTDFEVDKTLVSVIGDNNFKATFEDKEADFIVTGGDVPGMVKDLSAKNITFNSADITWKEPDSNNGNIINYYVYLQDNVPITVNDLNYLYTDLNEKTSYTVEVSAVNKFGEGPKSSVTFTTLEALAITGISAEYANESILVGNNFDTNKVIITVSYNDGTTNVITWNDLTIKPNTLVTQIDWNNYTLEYAGFSTNLQIHGYDYDRIESIYKGTNIPLNSNYNKSDVEVKLYYTQNLNNLDFKVLNENEWQESSLIITNVGNNEFTAVFKEKENLTSNFIVIGDDVVSSISAEYKGNDIFVGQNYKKDDVQVKLHYNSGTERILSSNEWTTDTTLVSNIGDNTFIATWGSLSTVYSVNGYAEQSIDATYVGSDIEVGQSYNKDDVIVVLTYTNGTTKTLPSSEWNENSLIVSQEGINTFTATYNTLTCNYIVSGIMSITVTSITANYIGPDIEIGNNYKKEDVTVTVTYSDNTSRTLDKSEFSVNSLLVTKEGSNNFVANYAGLTSNFSVNGLNLIKTISAIYKGPSIIVGNNYKKEDVEIKAYYSDNTERILSIDEWSADSLLVSSENSNNYIATFNGLNANYTVIGYLETVISETALVATYNGNTIIVGESYNKDDVIVTVYYSDNTNKVLNSSEWTENSLVVLNEGNNNFIATYKNLQDDYTVQGIFPEITITKLEAIYKGSDIIVGNNYKKEDVEVQVSYSDNTTKILSSNEWNANSLTVTNEGSNTFTATYNGLTTDYIVIGMKEPEQNIKEISLTAIYKGNTIIVGELYKKDDVIVTVYYSDNTSKVLNSNEWTESGLVIEKEGLNTFIASYKDLKANYNVPGKLIETGLIAKYIGPKIKTGFEYNKTDVEVIVIYNNGTQKKLTIDEWRSNNMKVEKVGKNDYVATHGNLTADYSIDGYKEIISIKAKYNGKKILVGNKYKKSDVKVKAIYHDGSEKVLKSSEWMANSLKVKKKGKNTFIATVNNLTAKYTVIGYKKKVPIEDEIPEDPPIRTPEDPKTPGEIVHTGVNDNFKLLFMLAFISISSFVLAFFKRKDDLNTEI